MSAAPCPICGKIGAVTVAGLRDDRFGYPGAFDLFQCGECWHRWLAWEPSEETLGALYSSFYPRSERSVEDLAPPPRRGPWRSWWHGQRSSAAFWVPKNVRVLDIGCGFGESLAYHRARDCDAWGVEADSNIARVAAHHGFNVHVGLFEPTRYEPASFDYVTMDQVIEHVVDPVETLRGVTQVLRDDGTAVLTTPNASSITAKLFRRHWINWHTPYHLHFFTHESLARAARAAGLEVTRIETITSSEWINYQWIHVLTRPAEGEPSPFWTNRSRRVRETVAIRTLRAAHRLGFDHALTRLLDAAGVGDNFVVHLRRAS